MLLACTRGEALAALNRQELQDMRTLATMTTVSVLLYYNLNGIPYEAGNLEAFSLRFERLSELSTKADDTRLAEQIRLLDDAFAQLQQLPQSTADVRSVWPAYSRWLPGVIEAHIRLETFLGERYSALPEVAQTLRRLHGLSHDIGRMLLYYQMASFPNFGGDIWIPDKQALSAMDAGIERGFAELAEHDPALAQRLNAPLRSYRFVRGHLLEPTGNWAPDAVSRYLGNAMRTLDTEARTLDSRAHG
ncbi:hypothetical protein I0E98_21530 [Pseudomonas lalucatii]|nr:hypothetical protein [Pseudomonas lalucatii]